MPMGTAVCLTENTMGASRGGDQRHHRDTAHAVEIAAAELKARKDIYGYDAVAWARYNDGQAAQALAPAQQAVSLGTQDPNLLYHLGMIEIALGH